ncbi:MAG: hypothetical protein A3F12_08050 [Gammaproteobacteria bacterium RIFCSPHIGHO2_12_FULL_38_14]|nr:MAG: hypothetical protein A3F12_08050 [Gammaproteobacteria bacterium RIFCSPHIGHO2_12_FULL_38_14]
MKLDIISFYDLNDTKNIDALTNLKTALLQKGIVGIRDVPAFENKSRAYIKAARMFAKLHESVKQKYAPNRDCGDTEGYELGAEWFKNKDGVWQVDDKKASFYAFVPDHVRNKWPLEVDLQTPYLELGELIFNTGKMLLNIIGLNDHVGLEHNKLVGYGRMLHYDKESDITNENPNWCGAHLDHGVFTGLIPAYYFREGVEINEPDEAGLYIVPSDGDQFEKINSSEKEILLFQVGEFGQLISDDRIKATKHRVRKAKGEIERFTFALFYSADDHTIIKSNSKLTQDERYKLNQFADGSISYAKWQKASFDRYRAIREK